MALDVPLLDLVESRGLERAAAMAKNRWQEEDSNHTACPQPLNLHTQTDDLMKRSFKILTIGDLGIFQRVVHLIMEKHGHTVEPIPAEALAAVNENAVSPDIICLFNREWGITETKQAARLLEIFPRVPLVNIGLENGFPDVLRSIRAGLCGYFPVTIDEKLFVAAFDQIISSSIYYYDLERERCRYSRTEDLENKVTLKTADALHPTLKKLLALLCTELDYPGIARAMQLKPAELTRYREELSKQLNLKSRVGLSLFAIYNGLDTAIEYASIS